jgi:hypothetical protein
MERTIWYKMLASGMKVRGWATPEPSEPDKVVFLEASGQRVEDMLSLPPTYAELHEVLARVGEERIILERADSRWKAGAVKVDEPENDTVSDAETAFDAAAEASANAERVVDVILGLEGFEVGQTVKFSHLGVDDWTGVIVAINGKIAFVEARTRTEGGITASIGHRPRLTLHVSTLRH